MLAEWSELGRSGVTGRGGALHAPTGEGSRTPAARRLSPAASDRFGPALSPAPPRIATSEARIGG